MDEVLARKLTKRLKWLNVWLTFFGLLFVAGFAIVGVLLFKVVHQLHTAEANLTSFEQKTKQELNVKSDVCAGSGNLSTLLQNHTGSCE